MAKRFIALITITSLILLISINGCTRIAKSEKPVASPPASKEAVSSSIIADTATSPPLYATPQTSASTASAPQGDNAQMTSENQPHEPPRNFLYDESLCKPWQLAYIALLNDICKDEATELTAQSQDSILKDPGEDYTYSLYDIDKDGIPEILIGKHCAPNKVYTFRDGKVAYIGAFDSSVDAGLYTCPDENGVIFHFGHMGYAFMNKISIVDEALVTTKIFEEDISVQPSTEYTESDKIIPGSVSLDEYRTILVLPEITPLTLPILDYYKPGVFPCAKTENGNDIIAVLVGKRELYGVTGDGFGGDTGWMFFKVYCQPRTVDQYSKESLQIKKNAWVDMNHDGCAECVLLLGMVGKDAGSSDKYVILSEQDDVVYAYCINYRDDAELYQDGVFVNNDGYYNWSFGVSFYKNQCYEYTEDRDTNVPAVTWDTGVG